MTYSSYFTPHVNVIWIERYVQFLLPDCLLANDLFITVHHLFLLVDIFRGLCVTVRGVLGLSLLT